MFLGQYEHTIDDKGRLAIPARFRSELADGLYVTAGVDRCLVILTPQAFQATADGVAALPWLSADARQVQRNLFAMATHLVPDKLGRIVLPPYLRAHAGVSGEVVVAGVYDRVEVWDRATWDAVRAEFLNGDRARLENLAGSLSRAPESA
jgi:MraZ protein